MPVTPDEDEFTELVDADFPRVDLVGKGANGIPRFLIAKQDEGAGGLLDAGFVRDLIAKSEPDESGRERVTMPSGVTLTGSPADIAAFIHKAAVRGPEDVAKAEMSSKAINDLPDSDFAFIEPGGKKDADGKTTPRSLRHFPVNDAAHVRNALSRAPQSPFGDKAMPKIRSRAKELGIEVSKEAGVEPVSKDALVSDPDDGIDGLDPTVPLAAPEDDSAPGDPTDPGSPAWEAIDAATAQKWTSIAVRLKNALSVMADRENLEALTADPDDAENAWDLQDAMCACDFVIDTLAGFAVGEQAEADLAAEAMDGIAKAMSGFDPAPLGVLEGLCAVAKAGRVLSAANEAAIRDAAASLQKVLTSLPQAPAADDIAKQKEATVAADQTGTATPAQVAKEDATPEAQAAASGPAEAGGTTGMGEPRSTGPAAALPGDGPQASLPGDPAGRQVVKAALQVAVYLRDGQMALADPAAIVQQIAKADGDDGKTPMQAVFDQDGQLIGIVDPAAITPVAGAGKKAAPEPDGDAKPAAEPDAKATDGADLTAAPAADAGTPADGPADDDVTKAAEGGPGTADVITATQDVLKSIVSEQVKAALETQSAAHAEVVAKMAADKAGLAEELEVVKGRLETVERHPAAPKVFTHGQVPPAGQLRGQDAGAPPIDVAKAAERKVQLYRAHDAAEQTRIAKEMQGEAIEALSALRAGAPVPAVPQHT